MELVPKMQKLIWSVIVFDDLKLRDFYYSHLKVNPLFLVEWLDEETMVVRVSSSHKVQFNRKQVPFLQVPPWNPHPLLGMKMLWGFSRNFEPFGLSFCSRCLKVNSLYHQQQIWTLSHHIVLFSKLDISSSFFNS